MLYVLYTMHISEYMHIFVKSIGISFKILLTLLLLVLFLFTSFKIRVFLFSKLDALHYFLWPILAQKL